MSKSSVLVRGMEMPKNCEECIAGIYEYNDNDERCFVCGFVKTQHPWECEHAEIDGIDTTKMRAYFCPLAEVTTPHGGLGDLDALVKTLEQNRLCYVLDIDDESFELGIDKAISIVKEAPTIIEAED